MRRDAFPSLVAVTLGAALSACQGAEPVSGLTNLLRVQGAQWTKGRLSEKGETAPVKVTAPRSSRSQVYPGMQDIVLSGLVGPGDPSGPLATAVAIGIDQEDSYWTLPAPDKDAANAFLMTFRASLSVSPDLDPALFPIDDTTGGPAMTLILRAVTQGQMGEIRPVTLGLLTQGDPEGDLVVSLSWNAPVDLDLHVIAPLPDGSDSIEVWAKNPSALPPDGQEGAPEDAVARAAGGLLDLDSNAACQIDNRDMENAVWTGPAPAGHFVARVDAFSLCGAKSASWHMTALLHGKLIQDTWGTVTAAHARLPHAAGSGMTAFEFDVQ